MAVNQDESLHMAKAQNNVAVIEETTGTAVAAAGDFSAFEGAPSGLENVTAQDLIIPRITILQALSPQLQKSKPDYNPIARQGDFCDTATGELWSDEMYVIPCFYARVYLEWAPRASGGGLVANHGTDASVLDKCTPDEKRRLITPNGNLIAETATFFVKNMSANGRRSFIPLSSTQLKNGRKWMTVICNERLKRGDGSEFMPPIYFRSWKAIPVEQSNSQGSWFGWKFEPSKNILELDPSKSLLKECIEFHEQARDGLVRGDVEGAAEEAAREQTTDGAM